MAVYYFASSVQIRTCTNFCTGSLGTPPKPRDHTSCELRVFTLIQSVNYANPISFIDVQGVNIY